MSPDVESAVGVRRLKGWVPRQDATGCYWQRRAGMEGRHLVEEEPMTEPEIQAIYGTGKETASDEQTQ